MWSSRDNMVTLASGAVLVQCHGKKNTRNVATTELGFSRSADARQPNPMSSAAAGAQDAGLVKCLPPHGAANAKRSEPDTT